jgi:hypothetical protein
MFILDPDLFITHNRSWILDPGPQYPDSGAQILDPTTKKRRGKKLFSYLFCSHKFKNIVNYLILNRYKKVDAKLQ